MVNKTGKSVSYYVVQIDNPNQAAEPYAAECGDIIEALGMTFNEGCAFKALWRSAAARSLGKVKHGHDAVYDAEKIEFYATRILSQVEYEMAMKQFAAVEALAKIDAATGQEQELQLVPKEVETPPGMYMKIDENFNMTGMMAVGLPKEATGLGFPDTYSYTDRDGVWHVGVNKIDLGLNEPSEAMKQAMDGGLTDTSCPFMCFPNNVCNKCGRTHNGYGFIPEPK